MPSARGSRRRYSYPCVLPAFTVWLAPTISPPRGGSQCSRNSRWLTSPRQHPSSHANCVSVAVSVPDATPAALISAGGGLGDVAGAAGGMFSVDWGEDGTVGASAGGGI